MRKKATVFRGGGAHNTSDDEKRQHKAEYERERYLKKKKEILAQQAEYYKNNQEQIRERRESYVGKYNKEHSVKHGDGRYGVKKDMRKRENRG